MPTVTRDSDKFTVQVNLSQILIPCSVISLLRCFRPIHSHQNSQCGKGIQYCICLELTDSNTILDEHCTMLLPAAATELVLTSQGEQVLLPDKLHAHCAVMGGMYHCLGERQSSITVKASQRFQSILTSSTGTCTTFFVTMVWGKLQASSWCVGVLHYPNSHLLSGTSLISQSTRMTLTEQLLSLT